MMDFDTSSLDDYGLEMTELFLTKVRIRLPFSNLVKYFHCVDIFSSEMYLPNLECVIKFIHFESLIFL